MPEPEPLISLGLSRSAAAPKLSALPDAGTLQFRKAETKDAAPGSTDTCGACKRAFAGQYYLVNGTKVCSPCGRALQEFQRTPRPHLLLKASVWGAGAALAGTILYSAIAIITDIQFALISILIGYMVGKVIRHACKGRGGRPQQIIAVILTYVSITASYIPIAIRDQMTNNSAKKAETTEVATTSGQDTGGAANTPSSRAGAPRQARRGPGFLMMTVILLGIMIAAPFLALPSVGGFLSLLIIFWGLQRAWIMSGQVPMVIVGPQGDNV